MNNLDKQYTDLLQDILDNGTRKMDRTETGTISVFGRQIRHDMKTGFPLLTTKKMAWKTIVTELLWFLRGGTNIKYLVDNNCHIWDGDAYKNYYNYMRDDRQWELDKEEFINKIKTDDEFAKKWGELGPIYGKQWRAWGGYEKVPNGWTHGAISSYREVPKNDQIAKAIHTLKTDPDSRRNRVSAWNVDELDEMVLPPCHTDFQFYTRELSLEERREIFIKQINGLHFQIFSLEGEEGIHREYDKQNVPRRAISLMWNQRSVDTFLGLPFNIASYGLLLEIIAKEVNMVSDELIGNLGDVHLYLNHIEQAKEQIGRELTLEERKKVWEENNFGQDISWHSMNDGDVLELLNEDNIPHRTREPYPLPKLFFKYEKETYVNDYELDGFILKDYQSHPAIKAPLSN